MAKVKYVKGVTVNFNRHFVYFLDSDMPEIVAKNVTALSKHTLLTSSEYGKMSKLVTDCASRSGTLLKAYIKKTGELLDKLCIITEDHIVIVEAYDGSKFAVSGGGISLVN